MYYENIHQLQMLYIIYFCETKEKYNPKIYLGGQAVLSNTKLAKAVSRTKLKPMFQTFFLSMT